MIVRWSWPRFRFDQLMSLAWKVMLPLGLVNLVAVACIMEVKKVYAEELASRFGGWTVPVLVLAGWIIFVVSTTVAAALSPLATDNRPRSDLRIFEVDPQV